MAESQTKSRDVKQKMCQLLRGWNFYLGSLYGGLGRDPRKKFPKKSLFAAHFSKFFSAAVMRCCNWRKKRSEVRGERLRRREARGKRQEVTSRQ
jgi:hypothetical protein